MKKLNLIILVLSTITFGLFAQPVELRGVVNNVNGVNITSGVVFSVEGVGPIQPGVSVNGPNEFTVIVPANSTLIFQHLEYRTTRYQVGANDQDGVQITMDIARPNYDAPQAPISAPINRPNSNAIPLRDKLPRTPHELALEEQFAKLSDDMRQRVGLPLRNDIDDIWGTSNGGWSTSFRNIIRSNYVTKQPEFTNWFAACATLAGTCDQVQILEQDVRTKRGYWNQFLDFYTVTDPSIFEKFDFEIVNFSLHPGCGKNLLRLMNNCGPIILALEGADKAVVISEVTCNRTDECYVYLCDYTNTPNDNPNPRFLGYSKLTITELHHRFNPNSVAPINVWVGIDEELTLRIMQGRSN